MKHDSGRSRRGPAAVACAAVAMASGAVTGAEGGVCPGDTNASGEVDVQDMLAVLSEWGCTDPPGPCAGDANADGLVNVQDLFMVLAYWGPCPNANACDDTAADCLPALCTTGCEGTACCAAICAADAGLVLAAQTLAQEAARFIITKGEVNASYAQDIWLGTYDPADGDVTILPAQGYDGDPTVTSLVGALLDAHSHTSVPVPPPCPSDEALPHIDPYGTLHVNPIPLTLDGWNGPYVRLTYELLDQLPHVRVTSRGVDGEIMWTAQADFRIDKKIEFVILSPSRIMIGKNVRVEGHLGTRYGLVGTCNDTPPGELCSANGDPLVMRSDFGGLDEKLDPTLDVLYQRIALYDNDGDNRLRPDHPVESQGMIGEPDLVDYDGNEYVDDFDLFLKFFDTNPQDGKVVYDATLATIYGGTPPVELDVDLQLARLIDHANPDRDADGAITLSDNLLGYHDGCLDGKDAYAKVKGRLLFAVGRDQWEAANGASYQTVVQGPIVSGIDVAPVTFETTDEDLPYLSTEMLQTAQSWFVLQVPASSTLAALVTECTSSGGTYTAANTAVPGTWESIPYNAPGAYDFIARPQFRNATFTNVRIPMGTNALFEDCYFVGVTFIETYEHCVDEKWNYTGAKQFVNGAYEDKYPGLTSNLNPPSGLEVSDTKPYSNNIRFHNCTFIGSVASDKPEKYTHWRNAAQFTGSTRFYFDPDDPDLLAQLDAAAIQAELAAMDEDTLHELRKSSIFLPGWPVAGGSFNNEQNADPSLTPRVSFKGCIVAGIMDVRGTADIFGTMLNTFHPVANDGPLFFGGLPDAFNATIGYFGPEDGDDEGVNRDDATFTGFGEITLRYDKDAPLPDGIPWRLCIQPVQ